MMRSSHPVKSILSLAVLMVNALLIGCGGGASNSNGSITSTPRLFVPFEFAVSAPRVSYARGVKIPLTLVVKNIGEQSRYLTAEEMEELARWFDSLDRL